MELNLKVDIVPLVGRKLWGVDAIHSVYDYLRFFCHPRYGSRRNLTFHVDDSEEGEASVTIRGEDESHLHEVGRWLTDWSDRGCLPMAFALLRKEDHGLHRIYATLEAFEEEYPEGVPEGAYLQIRTLRGGNG